MVVTINDSLFDARNGVRPWIFIRDDVILTINRTRFIGANPGGASQYGLGLENQNGDNPIVELNASTLVLESGDLADTLIRLDNTLTGGSFTLDNCTLIMRNGAGDGVAMIDIEAVGNIDIDIRNSILDGAGVLLVRESAASTADLTGWGNNLWFGDVTPTVIFDFDDETGVTTSAHVGGAGDFPLVDDTFGDPLFVSEVHTDDQYLMLGPGSPGIGLGDAASLPDGATTVDLLKYPFRNLTPNAGARAHRFRTKFPRFSEVM
jgi:hypothetical protein